jgi:hypothetical protein
MGLSLKQLGSLEFESKVKQLRFKGRPISTDLTKSLGEVWAYYRDALAASSGSQAKARRRSVRAAVPKSRREAGETAAG